MRVRPLARWLVIVVLGLVLIAALVYALLPFFNVDRYRNNIAEAFSTMLGRTVKLEGPMTLALSLHPTLVLEGVRIADPPWASRPNLLRAPRVEVQMSLIPLLRRELVIDKILVDGADLLLEEGPNGANNWTFGPDTELAISPEDKPERFFNLSEQGSIKVRRSRISYRPRGSKAPYHVTVAEASAVPVDDHLRRFAIEGTFRNVQFKIGITGGRILQLIELSEPWPIDGKVSAGGASAIVKGKLIGSDTGRSFDLAIELKGDRLSTLNPLLGAELPSFGPYELGARVSHSEEGLRVDDLSARVGRTELTGDLTLTTTGPRALVSGALAAETLWVDDFHSGDAALAPVHATRPSEPFAAPVDALRKLDVDFNLRANNVLLGDSRLGQARLTATLQEGLLQVDPFHAEMFGGAIRGALELDARESAVKATLEVEARSLDYGQALKSFHVTSQVSGSTDLAISLTGQGASVPEFLNHVALQMNAGPSSLVVGDKTSGEPLSIGIRQAGVTVSGGGPVKVLLDAGFRQKPLSVRLITGTLASLMTSSGSWPVKLSARGVDASVRAKGTITSEAQGLGGVLAVSLRGERLSLLDPDLPAKGPYFLGATLTKKGDRYTVTDLIGRLRGSDIAGSLVVRLEGPRPRLSGQLTSQRLNVADFSTPGDTDADIPTELLRSLDAGLIMQVGRVRAGRIRLADLSLRAELEKGVLVLAPVTGRLDDETPTHGEFDGALRLDAFAQTPTVSVKANLKDLNYGHLLKRFRISDRMEGLATMHLVFSGEGPTLFTMLAQSSFEVNADEMRMILQPKVETRPPVLFTSARIFAAKGDPLQLRASGRVKETPFTLTSSSGRLRGLIAQTGPWPLAISAQLPKASLSLNGHLHLPLDGEDFTFELAVDSERLSDLAPWVEGIPDVGPFGAKGTLAQTKEGLGLTGLRARLADSDAAGGLGFLTTGRRPRIVGKLTSKMIKFEGLSGEQSGPREPKDHSILHEVEAGVDKMTSEGREVVTELKEFAEDQPASGKAKYDRVFPDFRFPVDALRTVDLDLDWKMKDVEAPQTELGDVAFRVKLDDGELTVAPMRGTLWGGVIDGSLELDVAGTIPTLAVKMTIDELDYGRLVTSLGVTDLVTGRSDLITINLEGRGHTLREVLSRANGRHEVIDHRLQVKTKYIDLWASGLIRSALTGEWKTEKVTKFNCAVAYFDVVNGVAQSDAILFDTTSMTVAGVGTLDLGTEQIDLVLTPRPKDPALVSLAHTVRLTGYLSAPEVTSDKRRIAKSAGWGLLGLAAGPIGWALVTPQVMGTTLGTGDENPCAEAMGSRQHTAKKVVEMRRGWFDRVKHFFKGADTSSDDGTTNGGEVSP